MPLTSKSTLEVVLATLQAGEAISLLDIAYNEHVIDLFRKGTAQEVASTYTALHAALGDTFTARTKLGSGLSSFSIEFLIGSNPTIKQIFEKGTAQEVASTYTALHAALGDTFTARTKLGSGLSSFSIEFLIGSNPTIKQIFEKGTPQEVASTYEALHTALGDTFTAQTKLGLGFYATSVATLIITNPAIKQIFEKGTAQEVASAYEALHTAFGDTFTAQTKLGSGFYATSVATLIITNLAIKETFKDPAEDHCKAFCTVGLKISDILGDADTASQHKEHFCALAGESHDHNHGEKAAAAETL